MYIYKAGFDGSITGTITDYKHTRQDYLPSYSGDNASVLCVGGNDKNIKLFL
jgi:hypothetical protein